MMWNMKMKFPEKIDLEKYQEFQPIEEKNSWDWRIGRKVTIRNHKGEVLFEDEKWPGEPEDNCWGRDMDDTFNFGENIMYYSLKAWFEDPENGATTLVGSK